VIAVKPKLENTDLAAALDLITGMVNGEVAE
jgi:hypothetical protein